MVAVLIMLAAGLVAQTPTVEERVDYYDVAGSSEDELRAAIDKQRPKDRAGERHDAVTNWDVQLGHIATSPSAVTAAPSGRWPRRSKSSRFCRDGPIAKVGALTERWRQVTSQRSRHTSATIWTSRVVQHR